MVANLDIAGDAGLLNDLDTRGYSIIDDLFRPDEVLSITESIARANTTNPSFRRTNDLFAIRRFLHEIPDVQPLILTPRFRSLIAETFGNDYFIVKSIYFDKPADSNWFVAWHQDLTIAVDKRTSLPGFHHWTTKHGQFAVQPPLSILESLYTLRIHLDDTDEENGALRVIPGSHKRGIERYPASSQDNPEEICRVKSGGAMIMRPLLQHASNRSTGAKRRRVIHIEFSNIKLPFGLSWAEHLATIPLSFPKSKKSH